VAFKSILDIDVNDDKFKSFLSAFKEFQQDVERSPEEWAKINKIVGKGGKSQEKLTKDQRKALNSLAREMHRTAIGIDKATAAQNRFTRAVKKSAHVVHGMARGMRTVVSAGLRWGGIITGVGSLALFGLNEVAENVVRKQYAARSMGLQIGQRSAFGAAYGRVFGGKSGAESFLSKMAGAQQTPQGLAALSAMGVNPNRSAAKASREMAERIGMMYRNERRMGLSTFQASQTVSAFTQGMVPVQEIRALGKVSALTWHRMSVAERKYQQQMAISARHAEKWGRLWSAITGTLHGVENSLLQVLSGGKLLGEIQGGIKDAGAWLIREIKSPAVQRGIDEFGEWIGREVKYLESAQFKQTFDHFMSGVELVGDEIMDVARKLKWILHPVKSVENSAFMGGGRGAYYEKGNWKMMHGNLQYTGPSLFRNYNNPLGIEAYNGRYYTGRNGQDYERFSSGGDAYRKAASILRGYGTDRLSKIITKYEGSNTPHLAQHIDNIRKWSGFSPNKKLNLSNPETMAHLLSAIRRSEQPERHAPQVYYQKILDALRGISVPVTVIVNPNSPTKASARTHLASAAARH